METVPKRLELYLNTLGARKTAVPGFEVLTATRPSWEPLLVWPTTMRSTLGRRVKFDLVLLMQPPLLDDAGDLPRAADHRSGNPGRCDRPEYLLEPHSRKIAAIRRSIRGAGPAARLDEAVRQGSGSLSVEMPTLVTDPVARREL